MTDYAAETWTALQEDVRQPLATVTEEAVAPAVLQELQSTNRMLVERLQDVQMMFQLEDRGWELLLGGLASSDTPGLDLDQLKEVSTKIQSYIVGNPIIKRGTELRASYIWSKGVNIPGVNDDPSKRGRKSEVERFCRDPKTRRYLLSAESHLEKERAAVSSGEYLLVGDDEAKKILHPVPLSEITDVLVNPDYAGEVWAYKRQWRTLGAGGVAETKTLWYYTDQYIGVRKKELGREPWSVPVAQNRTIIDQTFNSQVGWPLGVPDGLAAIVWARIYSELMNHGKIMTEALAKFAMKVTVNSKSGASNVGLKLAGSGGSGQTAALGSGNDLVPLSSAGKSYDFDGIRAVAAQVATALEVSIVHLLSDPGAAGSSYGSASNLDLPTKRAMVSRQNTWAEYLQRVIRWGTGKDVQVTFPSLDDPDPYREMQIKAVAWNSGLVHADEARPQILQVAGMEALHDSAPDGVLLPNNQFSLARKDIDTDSAGTPTSGASPDQGASNGGGGTPGDVKNDLRTDGIGEALNRMANEAFLERLEDLVVRMELAKNS